MSNFFSIFASPSSKRKRAADSADIPESIRDCDSASHATTSSADTTQSSAVCPQEADRDRRCVDVEEETVSSEISRKYTTYNPEWKREFPWHATEEKDGTLILYCVPCRAQAEARTTVFGRGKDALVRGTSVIRRYTLTRHMNSESHKICAERHAASLAPVVTSQAARALKQMESEVADRVRNMMRTTHALCLKGRPFTDFVWLCTLDEQKGLDVGQAYRNDKACKLFSHYIAEVERKKMECRVKEAKFTSVICDGSTDSSTREQEIIYVKHCTDGKVCTDFVGVRILERGDANSIVEEVNSAFQSNLGLTPDQWKAKMVGFASDGAPVTMGRRSGVAARLKADRPKLVSVHCMAHRLELAFKDVVKQNALLTRVDSFLLNLYLFYRSALNRSMLMRACEAEGTAFLVPTRVGGTRWLSHTKRALENLEKIAVPVLTHLEQVVNPDCRKPVRADTRDKGRGLLRIMKTRQYQLTQAFLTDLVRPLSRASERLQKTGSGIADAFEAIEDLKQSVERMKTIDGPRLQGMRGQFTLGHHQLTAGDEAQFDEKMSILNNLSSALDNRFEDISTTILVAMRISNFSLWPAKTSAEWGTYGDEQVADIVAEYRTVLTAAGVDADAAVDEWPSLRREVERRYDVPANGNWEDLQACKHVFPNALLLVDFILSLPSHSADCERGFSLMKRIKSDWRSKLKNRTLTDLMRINLTTKPVAEFNPEPAFALWFSSTQRRRRPDTVPHGSRPAQPDSDSDSSDDSQSE